MTESTNNHIYYYHTDHLGTPIMLTDANQQTAWDATYEPFGKATITTASITNNLRFPGQYYDAETGLHYNWHRYYWPEVGRYITSDPVNLASINLPYDVKPWYPPDFSYKLLNSILEDLPRIGIQINTGNIKDPFHSLIKQILDSYKYNPIAQHPYLYVLGNPVLLIDLLGLGCDKRFNWSKFSNCIMGYPAQGRAFFASASACIVGAIVGAVCPNPPNVAFTLTMCGVAGILTYNCYLQALEPICPKK